MLIIVGIAGVGYAGYWIYSNVTYVKVAEYALVLSPSENQTITKHQLITFTATLTKDNIAVPGAAIEFYKDSTFLGGNTTDSNGKCTFTYNVTDAQGALLAFKARQWVP